MKVKNKMLKRRRSSLQFDYNNNKKIYIHIIKTSEKSKWAKMYVKCENQRQNSNLSALAWVNVEYQLMDFVCVCVCALSSFVHIHLALFSGNSRLNLAQTTVQTRIAHIFFSFQHFISVCFRINSVRTFVLVIYFAFVYVCTFWAFRPQSVSVWISFFFFLFSSVLFAHHGSRLNGATAENNSISRNVRI